jgi:hypothetical protein
VVLPLLLLGVVLVLWGVVANLLVVVAAAALLQLLPRERKLFDIVIPWTISSHPMNRLR